MNEVGRIILLMIHLQRFLYILDHMIFLPRSLKIWCLSTQGLLCIKIDGKNKNDYSRYSHRPLCSLFYRCISHEGAMFPVQSGGLLKFGNCVCVFVLFYFVLFSPSDCWTYHQQISVFQLVKLVWICLKDLPWKKNLKDRFTNKLVKIRFQGP